MFLSELARLGARSHPSLFLFLITYKQQLDFKSEFIIYYYYYSKQNRENNSCTVR